jgi:hypothetical protein
MPQKARRPSTTAARRRKEAKSGVSPVEEHPEAGHTVTPTDAPEVGKSATRSRARSVRKQSGGAATPLRGKTVAARKQLRKRPKTTGKAKLGAAAGGQTSAKDKFKRETFPEPPGMRRSGRSPKASQKRSGPKRTASVSKAAKNLKTSARVAKSPLRRRK